MYDPCYQFHYHQQQSKQQQLVWTDTSANLCKGLGWVDINIYTCKTPQSHFNKNYAVDLRCKKHGSDLMSVLSLHCAVLYNKESWRHWAREASLKPKAWSSVVFTWMSDYYRLGFAPTPRYLQNQILWWLYASLLGQTYKLRTPSVHTHAKRSHTHIRDHTVHIRLQ